MLTRKAPGENAYTNSVTVGHLYDLPNRPATRPIRLFELIASQPSTALRKLPGRASNSAIQASRSARRIVEGGQYGPIG